MSARRTTTTLEWPTLVVLAGFWAALVAVIATHHRVPWPLTVVALGLLGALHVSLQHEAIHGHPTPSQRLNEALVAVPTMLWLPYPEYRDSHRLHHRVRLTTPGVDPESHFVDQYSWDRSGRVWHRVLRANRTLLGRMVIWPGVAMFRTVRAGIRGSLRSTRVLQTWLAHLGLSALTIYLVCAVGGLPWWEFVVGFTYGGLSLTYLRSFAEHLPVDDGTMSAMVHSNPFWSLVFLNNNLHHTHHALPDLAWFRLPAQVAAQDSDRLAAGGAGLYRGYAEIARRFLTRPIAPPVHPGWYGTEATH